MRLSSFAYLTRDEGNSTVLKTVNSDGIEQYVLKFAKYGMYRYPTDPDLMPKNPNGQPLIRLDREDRAYIQQETNPGGHAERWNPNNESQWRLEFGTDGNTIIAKNESGATWGVLRYSIIERTFKRIQSICYNNWGGSRNQGSFPYRLNRFGQIAICR